jgi:hypothetical protein
LQIFQECGFLKMAPEKYLEEHQPDLQVSPEVNSEAEDTVTPATPV